MKQAKFHKTESIVCELAKVSDCSYFIQETIIRRLMTVLRIITMSRTRDPVIFVLK